MPRNHSLCLFAGLLLGLSGCQEAAPPEFAQNLVYRYVVEKMGDQPLGAASGDVEKIVVARFGEPDSISVPEDFASIIDHAQLAAGKTSYDKYCAACHGSNGDGRGPAAALLTPYPRDYRAGIFKFKSSLPGEKPTKADLADIIARGVPGTAMKPVPELNETDREAVANYVLYLSSRGELERSLLTTAAFDFDLEGGESFYPPTPTPADYSGMSAEEADELVNDLAFDITDGWEAAESYLDSVDVPEYLTDDTLVAERKEAAAKGADHFGTKEAACKTCHRFDENGIALPAEKKLYDVWTEEWTTRIQLDPENERELIPVMARGALPPREAIPRRLGHEPLRGGDDPRAIFAKIKFGIEGTPMPKTQIADNEIIWQLVAYVLEESRKIPVEPTNDTPSETPKQAASQERRL